MTAPTAGASDRRAGWGGASGPEVARWFHRALALVFLVAWVSLATQVRLLVGSHGLMPLADFLDAARAQGALSVRTFPSWLALAPGDGALLAGTWLGIALALLGLGGVRPRLCVALQTILYLGYVLACRTFLAFQWDNLLLECGLLAACLSTLPTLPASSTGRTAPVVHLLFRALLFKLYFESGIAKWQSPLGDWRDGSAMTFYYETAPLPTALAWHAHHLPRAWHLFESRATLAIELVVPFAVFGPRRARLAAAAVLTTFQILNVATANYGFFCFLSLGLHLFLLDDQDVRRCAAWWAARRSRLFARVPCLALRAQIAHRMRALLKRAGAPQPARSPSPSPVGTPATRAPRRASAVAHAVLGKAGMAGWILLSVGQALFHFGDPGPGTTRALLPMLEWTQTFRVVNTYHLFAAITRERIEPEFQVQAQNGDGNGDGGDWTALHLRYKPGDPARAPSFVAPHQPRVDFQLWFFGLAHERRQPAYVADLVARLCDDPDAVAPLFRSPLPARRRAVRIAFWRTTFTSPAERRATGDWWSRRAIGATPPWRCDGPPDGPRAEGH